jgi:hypothetical protein
VDLFEETRWLNQLPEKSLSANHPIRAEPLGEAVLRSSRGAAQSSSAITGVRNGLLRMSPVFSETPSSYLEIFHILLVENFHRFSDELRQRGIPF